MEKKQNSLFRIIGDNAGYQFSAYIGDMELFGVDALALFLYANTKMVRSVMRESIKSFEMLGDGELTTEDIIEDILNDREVIEAFGLVVPDGQ